MMRRVCLTATVLFAAAALSSCFDTEDPLATHQHGCFYDYNDDWNGLDLQLEHYDYRDCPAGASQQSYVTTGGTVYDYSANWPIEYAWYTEIRVWDEYIPWLTYGTDLIGSAGTMEFKWGPPGPSSSNAEDWQTPIYVGYSTRSSYDHSVLEVFMGNNAAISPRALWRIGYQGF